jgi:hypothetical protein
MTELIKKYKEEIDWRNKRLETAIYMGKNQKIRIGTEIALYEEVIKDLSALANCG